MFLLKGNFFEFEQVVAAIPFDQAQRALEQLVCGKRKCFHCPILLNFNSLRFSQVNGVSILLVNFMMHIFKQKDLDRMNRKIIAGEC